MNYSWWSYNSQGLNVWGMGTGRLWLWERQFWVWSALMRVRVNNGRIIMHNELELSRCGTESMVKKVSASGRSMAGLGADEFRA